MMYHNIKQLIISNKIEQALTELSRLNQEAGFQTYIAQQLTRFNRNENSYNWGIISRIDYEVENNKLTKALLELFSNLQNTPSVFTTSTNFSTNSTNINVMLNNSNTQNEPKKSKTLNIFLSYSHKDEELKEELDSHLAALKRNNLIRTWNDRSIAIGDEWDNVIKMQLAQADIILLLVSANFLASDYIWKIEIAEAMKRHDKREVVVVPIFIKPCDWKGMPFDKLQGLPKDAIPVTKHKDRDEALMSITKGIRALVERLAVS